MKKASDLAITGEALEALMKEYERQQKRTTQTPKQRKRKSEFKVEWVKFPIRWVERLQAANVGSTTYRLALIVLIENFRLEQMTVKEIVLSKEVTGMARKVRWRATNNLVRLKLIKVRRKAGGGGSTRVEDIYN